MADQAETAINTYSGKVIDFADPDPAQIDLRDIAWGLSRICRFGAQALHFHSVAQHSIAVATTTEQLAQPGLALAALHHDSHEAYSADIPRPLKTLLEPTYGGITGRLDTAIATALGIEFPDKQSDEGRLVKSIDDAAFVIEAERLLRGGAPSSATAVEISETVMNAARAVMPPLIEEIEFSKAPEAFLGIHHRLSATQGRLPSRNT